MSFAENFEKTAGLGDGLKYMGKAVWSTAKGAGKGIGDSLNRTAQKFKDEPEKFKKAWKGFKDPGSYEAAARMATNFAPEMAVAGLGAYGVKKYTDPKGYKEDLAMQYY